MPIYFDSITNVVEKINRYRSQTNDNIVFLINGGITNKINFNALLDRLEDKTMIHCLIGDDLRLLNVRIYLQKILQSYSKIYPWAIQLDSDDLIYYNNIINELDDEVDSVVFRHRYMRDNKVNNGEDWQYYNPCITEDVVGECIKQDNFSCFVGPRVAAKLSLNIVEHSISDKIISPILIYDRLYFGDDYYINSLNLLKSKKVKFSEEFNIIYSRDSDGVTKTQTRTISNLYEVVNSYKIVTDLLHNKFGDVIYKIYLYRLKDLSIWMKNLMRKYDV